MAQLRKIPSTDNVGWDGGRNLQVVTVNTSTRLFLIAGGDLVVDIADNTVATVSAASASKRDKSDKTLSAWEKGNDIRELRVTGKRVGSTTLTAKLSGRDWIAPLTVDVVADKNASRTSMNNVTVSETLKSQVRAASIRDAVLLVAEDQMHSKICKGSGFGVYDDPTIPTTHKDKTVHNDPLNWCGSFAFWCWRMACEIKGVTNPLGGSRDNFRSPIKAISWAMRPDTRGHLLRYAGPDAMGRVAGNQPYHEIGYCGYGVEKADVVLLRILEKGVEKWKHVCLAHTPGGSFKTIDGNQGNGECIKIVSRDTAALVNPKKPLVYQLVFVHILV